MRLLARLPCLARVSCCCCCCRLQYPVTAAALGAAVLLGRIGYFEVCWGRGGEGGSGPRGSS